MRNDVCLYDNPEIHHRESWFNGEMIGSLSCDALYHQHLPREFKAHFMASVPFREGQIIGDANAMAKDKEA